MTDVETEFDFAELEVKEDEPAMPPPENICQTPGCMNPTVYGGRGPRPKMCPEHKRQPSKTTRSKKKTGTDYTEALTGLLQLPAMALTMVGTQQKKIAYLADAAVLTYHTPAIASAVNDIANERPEVAAVLDKVLKVGPYGVLITALMPMAIQVMANHNIIPAGIAGTQSPEEVLGLPPRRGPERMPDAE